MPQVEAEIVVTKRIAESLPSNPQAVKVCMDEAEVSMNELAKERGRKVCEPPRYMGAQDTGLGYVRLSFVAETDVL